MLLRRVLLHFRKQDWIAIILDFIIVVVGIFVGLQVDQWNQSRQDRVLERQYIAALKADFEADIEELDDTIAFAKSRADTHRRLLTAIETGQVNFAADDFIRAVNSVVLLNFLSYTRTTINDLMSTGNLQLIRSEETRRKIAAYYANIAYREQWVANWRAVQIEIEHTLPHFLDFEFREPFWLEYSGGPPWITRPIEAEEEDVERILALLREHPLAREQIQNMTRIQDSHYVNQVYIRRMAIGLPESL